MKRILIPISFSDTSACSLIQAVSLFDQSQLTLLHCYSPHEYNRTYDFGNRDYDEGIREMMLDFCSKHIPDHEGEINLLTSTEDVSANVAQISPRFDLMVISKNGKQGRHDRWLSDKVFYVTSKARCPVLLLPLGHVVHFDQCKNVWHIKRREAETPLLHEVLPGMGIDQDAIQVKTLDQTTFISSFWKTLISYSRTHDEALLDQISKYSKAEQIDLIILVNYARDTFESFISGDIVRIMGKHEIPMLIFQRQKVSADD